MSGINISLEEFHKYLLGVKSKATAVRYAEYAARFLQVMKASGYDSFAKIPPGMLSEFASELSRQGNKPSTVRVYTFAAKKYLEWVKMRGVTVTEQSRPDLPKVQLKSRPVMQQELFTRFFRQADLELLEPVRTAVMLLPCCGLRGGEIVALRLENIHKADVKLKNGKTKKTLFLRFIGKGGKQRSVPLMEEGVEILTGYLAGWRKKQRGPWLFPSVHTDDIKGTKHMSDRGLRHALQVLCEALGEDFSPHTMRRTYITTLYRKGVDLKTLAEIAGHANIQTTINHYIITEPSETLEAFHNAGGALTE